jgi:PleD family two-component response regulator
MKKPYVLLSGKMISRDTALIAELQKSAEVLSIHDNNTIDAILEARQVDVIILEVAGQNAGEVEIVQRVKSRYPGTKIIFIDGGRKLMGLAFQYGVADAYRKPYKNEMLVERVKVLLGLLT